MKSLAFDKRLCWVLVAALMLGGIPMAALADDDAGGGSDGATFTIALAVTMVVILLAIGLKSDIERLSSKERDERLARAAKAMDESPIVFKVLTDKPANRSGAEEPALAGAAVGLRVNF